MTARRHSIWAVVLLALAVCVADQVSFAAGRGRGRGGPGGGKGPGGGMGGWGWTRPDGSTPTPWWQRQQQEDPIVAQKKAEEKARKLVADGWDALRAGDAPAAFEAFADALALNANLGEARLGEGLSRAAKGDFTRALIDIEASRAMTVKVDPRLVTYNAAVAHTRMNGRARAMVLLHRPITESLAKGPDELMVNAQLTIASWMDEKQRKAIGQMPDFQKSLSNANGILASRKYGGMERLGLAWVSATDARRILEAGEKETFPAKLPFVMPSHESVPESSGTVAYESLMPAGSGREAAVAAVAPKAQPKPNPEIAMAERPEPKAPTGPFKLGGGGSTPSPVASVAIAPSPEIAPVPAVIPEASRKVIRTVRGAAFAVAPDMLITCARLVAGAKEIQLQSTEGRPVDATVVAIDETLGLALIKANGATFKPMALADATHAGKVGVAAFIRPTVFNPDLDLVAGDLYGAPGALSLRCAQHPRSAGSPLVNEKGIVLAVLIASREDAIDKLPIVAVDALRKFAGQKVSFATTTSAEPDDSVVELTATRHD